MKRSAVDYTRLLHAVCSFMLIAIFVAGNYFSGGERYRPEFDEALDNYVKGFLHEDERLFEVVKFQYKNWSDNPKPSDYQRGDVSLTHMT
jgi:hypothetical protein